MKYFFFKKEEKVISQDIIILFVFSAFVLLLGWCQIALNDAR